MVDRIGEVLTDQVGDDAAEQGCLVKKPAPPAREWGKHPLDIRVSVPLLFGRWYVTLVAGPERRSKERLISEREKRPLETLPNLMFLLSIGIVTTTSLLLVVAIILFQGFGWSIELTIPS